MRKTTAYVTSILSLTLGGGSLLGFMVFLYAGPLNLIDLGLEGHQVLLFDAGISLLFFAQHSIMIRQSFRRFAERFIPEVYGSALYSISSGVVLAAVIVLWQGSETSDSIRRGAFPNCAPGGLFPVHNGILSGCPHVEAFRRFWCCQDQERPEKKTTPGNALCRGRGVQNSSPPLVLSEPDGNLGLS